MISDVGDACVVTGKGIGEGKTLLKWDSKAIGWQKCAWPRGADRICGESPSNEFEGQWYCKEHFDLAQKRG